MEQLMNVIPAQEIKRRGITAVDEALTLGPVHIIKNNRPQYVVLTESDYQELVATQQQTTLSRIKASLNDQQEKRITQHNSVEELLHHLDNPAT
jgi:PHD/YefM family antitoxin component YafN of YafNO toxin-antitoxin module